MSIKWRAILALLGCCWLMMPSAFSSVVGPLEAGLDLSSEWGPMLWASYTNQITRNQAFNLNLGLGGERFNLMANWGWALLPYQRLKITALNYSQKPEFTFRAKSHQEWVSQPLLAATYQSQLPILPITGHATAYVAHARDKDYGTDRLGSGQNIQHATGGWLSGVSAGAQGGLFGIGQISGTVYYDYLSYDMDFQSDIQEQGPGLKIQYQKSLLGMMQLWMSGEWRSPFNRYEAGGDATLLGASHSQVQLHAKAQHIEPDLHIDDDNRLAVSVSYAWGKDKDQDRWQLNEWTAQPAEYIPEVFVKRDETVR